MINVNPPGRFRSDAVPARVSAAPVGDVELRDGSRLHVRPIQPDDAEGLGLLHRGLSRQSLFYRFMAPQPEITDAQMAYLSRVDGDRVVGLAGEIDGRLVAAAHCFRDETDAKCGEIALVTDESLHGRGIGTHMLARLAEACRAHDITKLDSLVHGENHPMLSLLQHSGFEMTRRLFGPQVMVSLSLAAPLVGGLAVANLPAAV